MQKAPKVLSPPKTTIAGMRVQTKKQVHFLLKSPLGGNIPSIEGRQRWISIPRFPISKEATVFDVDNNSNDEHPIGNLR